MDTIYNQPIVLDNGSGTIRCGFSADEAPRVCYSNILGKPKYQKIEYLPSDISVNDTFIGDQAQVKRGLLKLRYPIEHGIIEDWNSMEQIWEQVLRNDLVKDVNDEKLDISFNEHAILLTEQPFTTRKQRERMCEIMFETFGVAGINVSIPAVLSLYSTGRTTGGSVDIGDGVSSIAAIWDGFVLPGSITRINLAGRDISRQLQVEVMKCGYSMNSSSEFEIIRSMKERIGFVALNKQSQYESTKQFQLPDGKFLKMTNVSLSRPSELLFKPELFGFEDLNIQESLYNCIMKTDMDLRKKMFETIVLSGGATLMKNFGARLISELAKIDDEVKFKMFASPERRNNCFVGGSVLSSLSTFNNVVFSKKQFMEDHNCIYDKYF